MTETSPPSSATGRQKSSAITRQAMLDAARRRFLQESYENVGLRDVARDAGVDVALVGRYFGSKEELFREVLGVGHDQEIVPPGIPASDIPGHLAELFMQQGEDGNEQVERLLIILRSASSPSASKIVRDALSNDVLQPLAGKLGGARPELRASTSMAVWMGMTIMRTVMSVEPLCAADHEVEQRIKALFEAALADRA